MCDFQSKKTNDLITLLISKLDDCSSSMGSRVKVNSIFSEFDEKTRDQLNEFIRLSQMRYKGVKSGNDLQNLLAAQKTAYSTITDQIANDNFYSNKEIDEEKKKLFKKTNRKKTAEINLLRARIKEDTKNFSQYELKVRERLLKRVERKRKKATEYRPLSRLAYNYTPRFSFDTKMQQKEPSVSHEENVEENELETTNSVDEKRLYFEELMNEDAKKIKSSINDYSDYLGGVKSSHENGQAMKLNHKFNFLTEDIKLLTYKEEKESAVVVKKKEDPAIDIIKLMRYTKRGKKSKWLNPPKTINASHPTKSLAQQSTMNKTGSEFRSTRMTIKSEAEKVAGIEEVFSKKRDTLTNFYKHFELPTANEYEELIRIKSGKPSFHLGTNQLAGYKEASVPSGGEKRTISSGYRRTYGDKAALWKHYDDENKLKAAKEEERRKEITVFFKKVKNASRKPHYFIDCYSKKDTTNKKIAQINKSLGSTFNSKRTIERKVLEYDSKQGLKETTNADHFKRKNKDLAKGEEVAKKIRKNLEYEEKPEEIDLTYKVFAQKIVGKQKSDPYEEFLEFKARIADRDTVKPIGNKLPSPPLLQSYNSNAHSRLDPLSSPVKDNGVNLPLESNNRDSIKEDNSNSDMKFILVEKVNET